MIGSHGFLTKAFYGSNARREAIKTIASQCSKPLVGCLIWRFPKNRGTPKRKVDNGKPYKNG